MFHDSGHSTSGLFKPALRTSYSPGYRRLRVRRHLGVVSDGAVGCGARPYCITLLQSSNSASTPSPLGRFPREVFTPLQGRRLGFPADAVGSFRTATEFVSGNVGAGVVQPRVDAIPGAGVGRCTQQILGTDTESIGSPNPRFEKGCASVPEVLLRAAWGGSNFSTTRQYAIWLVEALGVRCESSSGNVGEFTRPGHSSTDCCGAPGGIRTHNRRIRSPREQSNLLIDQY